MCKIAFGKYICRCGAVWGEGHIFMVLLKGLELVIIAVEASLILR